MRAFVAVQQKKSEVVDMRKRNKVPINLAISVMLAIYCIPIFYMLSLSFKKVGSAIDGSIIPKDPTLKNYIDVFTSGIYTKYLSNGLIVSLCSSLLAVVLGFFAAYALSRFKFFGKEGLFVGLIAIKAMPPVLMSIAFFHILVNIKLYNTLASLIILNTIFNLPLAVWMLRNFIDAVPSELDESAHIDGCGQLRYLVSVMLPLSMTGIAAIFVQCFLLSWNEYMFAVTYITSSAKKTPTVAIFDFIGQWSTNYIGIVTFAVLLSLPVVIAFISVQRYFVKGMLAGYDK